jgi:hypothetical protein
MLLPVENKWKEITPFSQNNPNNKKSDTFYTYSNKGFYCALFKLPNCVLPTMNLIIKSQFLSLRECNELPHWTFNSSAVPDNCKISDHSDVATLSKHSVLDNVNYMKHK